MGVVWKPLFRSIPVGTAERSLARVPVTLVHMPDPYCTAGDITTLAGQLAVNLRTDDVADIDSHLESAATWARGRIDFYCSRYSQTVLAGNEWINGVATFLGVFWLCTHRLNEVPTSIQKMWEEEYKPELVLIQKGQAEVPRAAKTRRPITVTNTNIDNRRFNNQIRVDTTRSTGVAKDYKRPTDPNAPDER